MSGELAYTLPDVDANTYTSLIESFFQDQPNFMATVELTTNPFIALENFFQAMIPAYNLDSAIGIQLDVLGTIVGVSRRITEPIANVYFSFGISGVGFGQGLWKGPFDPIEGLTQLDDDDFRTLIKAKIAANSWDGTLPGVKAVLTDLLGEDTLIFYQDNQDMTITVAVSGVTPAVIPWALITGGYIPLKPAGVGVREYGVSSVNGTPLFGFGASNQYIGGWGQGSWITGTLP